MLTPTRHHPWDMTPKEAISLQRELAQYINLSDQHGPFNTVAGIDLGIKGEVVRAAVVAFRLPELEMVESVSSERPLAFPYVPGLLSFREAPAILDALERLQGTPDVLIFDGQGYAHPRRMGIATHLGILLDHPTIGCAKSRLCGTYEEPQLDRGSCSWLRDGEEIIGAVVRTRTRVKPVFVSAGHRVTLQTATDTIQRCGAGYRLHEPKRWAHRMASAKQ